MDWQNTKDRVLLIAILFIAIHAISSYINEIFLSIKFKKTLTFEHSYKKHIREYIIIIEITIVTMYISLFFVDTNSTENADISIRIENISQNLAESSTELSKIQQELEERIKYVENLKAEAEVAQNVISLTDEQVNAVQAKLNQELEASSNKGMIQSILIASFFFVLGYIVQPILNWIKRKTGRTTENKDVTPHAQYSAVEIERAIMLLETMKQNENSIKD